MNRIIKHCLIFIGFIFLVPLILPAHARATISISTTVDKTHLTIDDTLTLSVKINGVQSSNQPVLPPLPDFQIEAGGTSSSIQVINGEMKSSVTFRYLLIPKKEGRFEIGPVHLEMDGKHYESPPMVVYISEPTASLPDSDKALFVEAVVSNTTPYLQEQISLTYRLFRKVEVRNLSLDAPLEHFRKVPLGEPTETTRVINGVRYYISEINYALYPMQSGILKIPAAIFQMDVVKRNGQGRSPFGSGHLPGSIFNDPFFSGGATLTRKVLHTKPIEIKVNPFPEKNKPRGFSNLVGPVIIGSELKPDTLTAGDTATWTLTVQGRGNMGEATVDIQESPGQFKIYKDQPVTDEKAVNGFLEGSKTFTFAIVPINEGTITLPLAKLTYWDPEAKEYREVTSKSVSLNVKPGQSQPVEQSPQSNTVGRPSANIGTGPALLPIHTRPDLFGNPDDLKENPWTWVIGFLVPFVGYICFRALYSNRIRMKRDTVFARKKQAYPKAIQRLEELKERQKENGQTHAREVSLIFREYLGDRFSFQGTALTPDELEERLREGTINENQITSMLGLLNKCQTLEFAPAGQKSNDDLVNESLQLLSHLEKNGE